MNKTPHKKEIHLSTMPFIASKYTLTLCDIYASTIEMKHFIWAENRCHECTKILEELNKNLCDKNL